MEVDAAHTARTSIEEAVLARSRLLTAGHVDDTCSFARTERLLKREYHGRFLIELLQNAADAWRDSNESGRRTDVRIVLSDAPALLVANRGTRFPAEAVVRSLGQIGASTKDAGEAIGHKGIGFKSVLEVTTRPELYSRAPDAADAVSVRFDPQGALDLIREHSPNWTEHLAGVRGIASELDAVPTLRYPMWVDEPPGDVAALIDEGFDTIIRLPFDAELRPDPALDEPTWLKVVRASFEDVTDEMLLLLGTFGCVDIRDELGGDPRVIEPDWGKEETLADGTRAVSVTVRTNGDVSSRWQCYSRDIPGRTSLAGGIAVAARPASTSK